jgi:eukaryotic-like serine/threonine-protein kinase
VILKVESETGRVSAEDALRTLCFADVVFRERYEGWHALGRGAWATVVRTRSRDFGRDIALKIFVNLDSELLERVREEVRAAQALATPYLVHTYSLFDRGTIAWFEMELVDGPNLHQEMDRLAAVGERMSLVRAYEIALAVSRCVWHAHLRGVLHRDIKPANVLLPASREPAAKMSDFGIARLSDTSGATPPGTVTGTPWFASPEALAGRAVGPAHDVYALGATLYALLAGGKRPYEATGRAPISSLRRLQLSQRPHPLHMLAPGVDVDVENVLLEALRPEPSGRPPLRRIVTTLEHAQARVIAAGRPSPGIPVTVRPWRVALASLGFAAFGLCARFRKRQRYRDPSWRNGPAGRNRV